MTFFCVIDRNIKKKTGEGQIFFKEEIDVEQSFLNKLRIYTGNSWTKVVV